jgi:hypothetical protein
MPSAATSTAAHRLQLSLPPPTGNPVRYVFGTFPKDERAGPEDERDLGEDPAVTSVNEAAAAGGSGISGPGAGYRRIDRPKRSSPSLY